VSPFGSLIPPQPAVCFRNERLLPSSASRNVNISPVLSTLRILPVVTGVSPLRHSPSMPSPSLCSLCLCGKLHVFSSLPPLEISCRSFCKPCPLFSIACGLFSKNTGGGMSGEHTRPFSRRSACGAVSTFRINTSKSVSKQTTLTSFRMNTYEKPRGRGDPASTVRTKQEGTQGRALFTIPINAASTTRWRLWRSCLLLRLPCCRRRRPLGAW
jgi:hypothetical protein